MADSAYGPGQGPSARPLDEAEALRILERQQFGVLATVKRDGHPHLASMVYQWDAGRRRLRFSSVDGRIKVVHLRRDPRATLHVQGDDVLSYMVAEGRATVSEPSRRSGDATGRELLEMAGDQPEATLYLDQMAKEGRVVITLQVTRLYGVALDGPAEE
ncbi:pyridoxamine 5'-phosphate oxidase family protein [Actinoplanes couchii]|uniref:PPOX class F420-dependent enzyme n=1 Tax=Actinoplanes couchii TaxID=403638 RepID=A0ABQ3XNS9_9ACTN|nr:TIGR03618 family F420-dependent PPOX class oxidoreductase [Actinoplanes couchii]MDR6319615.1 PPOX class probable F420-dependent enzyme [Actinoplanes couchii]GID60162.1 PPOX class F420-dependent enzyme [Actinoplanes couchii]